MYKVITCHIDYLQDFINAEASYGWKVITLARVNNYCTVIMIKESNAEKSI